MGQIRIAPFDMTVRLGDVLAVMEAAYGLEDSGTRQRERIVLRHAGRKGLVTRGALASANRLVGFCYGFPSDDESWWDQQVHPRLTAQGNAGWLDGGAFELTELHVHPEYHGQGVGRRLITAVLAASDLETALLTTRAGESAARRLYASLGFADLTAPFHFGPGQPAYTVMGTRLPTCAGVGRAAATRAERG